MPAMATHYTSSALSVASTLHAEVFLVATAIWTHFRLCLLSATSMPCMLRRHHTLQLYLVGNIRCSLVPFHSTIYKRCLNTIGCTVCVATAIYKRCLNISSVPCLPALAPATALSEDRRREGAEQSHVEMSSKLFVISPPLPPAAAKKRWRLIGNLLGLRGQRTRFDGAPAYISVHNMSSNIRSIFGSVDHFSFLVLFNHMQT